LPGPVGTFTVTAGPGHGHREGRGHAGGIAGINGHESAAAAGVRLRVGGPGAGRQPPRQRLPVCRGVSSDHLSDVSRRLGQVMCHGDSDK
jgi:hypothetical protein